MKHHNIKLILASQSPRRCELLREAGFKFSVMAPGDDIERAAPQNLPPAQLVAESARLKAKFIAQKIESGLVLAADTLAHCGDTVLGKPSSRADARQMLQTMSGTQHTVLTGVCLWDRPSNVYRCWCETTLLRMDVLREETIEAYLDSGQWQGKAGAFGYQDGLDWVHIESGLASNVVGLPVEKLDGWIRELADSEPAESTVDFN